VSLGGIVYPRRCNQAQSNARKPCRGRIPIRCGSGDSGSLSGCERERADTKSGCLVRGRASPKPGGKVALLARESKAVGRRRAHGRSWRSSNGADTSVLASDEGTQRSDRFRRGSSRRARTRAARRGGSAPAARSSTVRSRRRRGESVRAFFTRGGRGPGGSQSRSASRSTRTEAGDGESPAPSTSPCRANGERTCPKGPCLGERRTPNRLDGARARLFASTRERRSRRDGPRSCFFGSA